VIITSFERPIGQFYIDGDCIYCQTSGQLEATTFATGIAFFIFTFPKDKRIEAHCTQCKKHYAHKEFNHQMLRSYQEKKTMYSMRTPLWFYMGIFLLVILLIIGSLADPGDQP